MRTLVSTEFAERALPLAERLRRDGVWIKIAVGNFAFAPDTARTRSVARKFVADLGVIFP
jgi:hypothetical protein